MFYIFREVKFPWYFYWRWKEEKKKNVLYIRNEMKGIFKAEIKVKKEVSIIYAE